MDDSDPCADCFDGYLPERKPDGYGDDDSRILHAADIEEGIAEIQYIMRWGIRNSGGCPGFWRIRQRDL